MKFIRELFASHARAVGGISTGIEHIHTSEIVFMGRDRTEARRRMIRFWSQNQTRLGMDLSEFTRSCDFEDDEKTIVFRKGLMVSWL